MFVAALATALFGCPRTSPQSPPPGGSGGPDKCVAGVSSNDLPMNDLPMNDLPMNGMSTASLNDNKPLLDAIKTVALTEDLFMTPDRAALLGTEHGVELMKYVAACALDPCDDIVAPKTLAAAKAATLPERATGRVFAGELGLCGRTSETPWRTGAPDAACLRRVSGCMLARTNAIGAKVRLSLRGDRTHLADKVPIATMYRENHGTPIRSLQPCTSEARDANCGWTPQYVGRCAAGAAVRIEAQTSTGHPLELRVCSGTFGCDAGGAEPPFYAGGALAPAPGSDGDTVEVTCPANGPRDQQGQVTTGYYAVMVRATNGAPLAPADVSTTATPTDPPYAYPASEAEVFVFHEGAFFGDLFSPAPPRPLSPGPPPPEPTLSGLQFACYSNEWSEGKAMLSHRLCAGPVGSVPEGCFGTEPQSCNECNESHATGQPTAIACAAAAREWNEPYTTYLDHPCALIATREACDFLRGTTPIP